MDKTKATQTIETTNQTLTQPVAVVGMALRVPGANTLEQFWNNVLTGKDCLYRASLHELEQMGVSADSLHDGSYIGSKPRLENIEYFDREFFDIPKSQAELIDPAQRLFLECAWEATEQAGIVSGRDNCVGVFAGVEGDYLHENLSTSREITLADSLPKLLGSSIDYLTLRVSYKMDLVGPSFTVMATCATSLLAIHLAMQSLRLGECSAAIAGGAKIDLPASLGYVKGIDGMSSTSGTVSPFDIDADGTIFGDGVGVVALRLLKDAIKDGNPIHGVILGSGICNDGRPEGKKSFIAPTVFGQKHAIARAIDEAGIDARSIGYVECHGTGTPLGDPIEINSLTDVFRRHSDENGFCAIGSVKGNVGHLGTAAGAVSLIKTCLTLKHRQLPPVANFKQANPKINFANSPFFVPDISQDWKSDHDRRRAGVSAFGFGGANAHLVVEEYVDDREVAVLQGSEQSPAGCLLTFSAMSSLALQRRLADIAVYLEQNPETQLPDLAYTLQHGRKAMVFRTCVVVDDQQLGPAANALRNLKISTESCEENRPVVFLFPGQGSQTPGMGQVLYEHEPVYHEIVDYCTDFLRVELGFDLRDKIHCAGGVADSNAEAELTHTGIAQPALFVVEYAMARLFMERGLQPDSMLGHSLGELVSACLAGVFSLDDALHMIALRSRLMQQCVTGTMAAVFLPVNELLEILPPELDLAAENGPTTNVVSGATEAIDNFIKILDEKGIGNRLLATSHAFHSSLMEPILDDFAQGLADISFSTPRQIVISNITGLPLTDEQALDLNYWVELIRRPVKFSSGLSGLLQKQNPIFVEMGPGRVLTGLVSRHDPSLDPIAVLDSQYTEKQYRPDCIVEQVLGAAWIQGADINWTFRSSAYKAQLLTLPPYPFQQNYLWQDCTKEEVKHEYPLFLYEPGWIRKEIDGQAISKESYDWLVFLDVGGLADQVVTALKLVCGDITLVRIGDQFLSASENTFEVAAGSRDDLERVLREAVDTHAGRRLRVLHFWSMANREHSTNGLAAFELSRDLGFHTLLALGQAAHACGLSGRMDVQVYTDGIAQVNEQDDALYPDKGVLLGPCMVMPQEVPGLSMRCIDVPCESGASLDQSIVKLIFAEAMMDSEDVLTALRSEGRFVEELFALHEINHCQPRMRYGGTVLITGGVGGLGLQIAKFLFNSLQVRLVLTSRWQAPPQEQWSQYTHEDSKMGHALRLLSDLVDSGAEILIVQADVCDPVSMKHVLDEADKAFGAIHGVVHAAGVLDDGPAISKTRDSADKVLATKVVSAYLLDSLFHKRPLDMFIYFSSQASVRPGKGQVDYAAANAILDRLAKRRKQSESGMVCAMGWGPWRSVGMAWHYMMSKPEISSFFADKPGTIDDANVDSVDHPILKSYHRFENGDALFFGTLVRNEHWISQEHVIGNRPVVSATTILEMMRAGAAELLPECAALELSRFILIAPLIVEDRTDFELLYKNNDAGYSVELRSRMSLAGANWLMQSRAEAKVIPPPDSLDEDLTQRLLLLLREQLKPSTAFEQGPRWRCEWVEQEYGEEVAVRVKLDARFHHEVCEYGVHPSIFDRSIHCIADHMFGKRLPYTCDMLRIYRQMPAETLCYGKRSANDENDALDIVITDVDGNLVAELDGYVMRILTEELMAKGVWEEERNHAWAMKQDKPGVLDSFSPRVLLEQPLGPEEVRIEVRAAGLNFRDVLSALGQLPLADKSRNMVGSECSGVVVEVGKKVSHCQPGDRVASMTSQCFASSVVADSQTVTHLPERLSFSEGASILLTFLTSDLALSVLGRLKKDERVLIHSATGGIGLAAVQLAQKIGAEIYATAGSDIKRDYLRSIGVKYVMNSRSLDFVEQVKEFTGGEGVDVVLNALAGEFIPASLGLLRPFGRFIEIGKRDIYANTKMGLYPFRNNISYFGADLGQFATHRRQDLKNMLDEMMMRFATGELKPSPLRIFGMLEIGKGFEFMARAQHIGKIIFRVEKHVEDSELAMEKFNSRFGTGIGLQEGLSVFQQLIASEQTPPCVTVVADSLTGTDVFVRHQVEKRAVRTVDTPFVAPRNHNEELLQHIWEKGLGVSPIGIDDDFVDLGGDSVNAIMIQVAVEATFDIDLTMSVLFSHPSIAKFAGLLDEKVDLTS